MAFFSRSVAVFGLAMMIGLSPSTSAKASVLVAELLININIFLTSIAFVYAEDSDQQAARYFKERDVGQVLNADASQPPAPDLREVEFEGVILPSAPGSLSAQVESILKAQSIAEPIYGAVPLSDTPAAPLGESGVTLLYETIEDSTIFGLAGQILVVTLGDFPGQSPASFADLQQYDQEVDLTLRLALAEPIEAVPVSALAALFFAAAGASLRASRDRNGHPLP